MREITIQTQEQLGRRIAHGREEAGLTQSALAETVGLDRTALAKSEAGARKVTATELIRIASALDRPIDWFVVESPQAVLSRRADPQVGGESPALDLRVERLARDVSFLIQNRILPASERTPLEVPTGFNEAENLAGIARSQMGVEVGPVIDLQRRVERVGLLGFSINLGEDAGDAAYVEVEGLGVSLVNGATDPGRRRFNLAHELGHHLTGDAYAPEAWISGSETERYLNAFAAHLLMPRDPVKAVWEEFGMDRRLAVVAVSVRFRVSWSAACSHVMNLDLIGRSEFDELSDSPPRRGDLLELGESWVSELDPPCVPPEYARRVIAAYRGGRLTSARATELLWNSVREEELPELEPIPVEAFRGDLEPLQ